MGSKCCFRTAKHIAPYAHSNVYAQLLGMRLPMAGLGCCKMRLPMARLSCCKRRLRMAMAQRLWRGTHADSATGTSWMRCTHPVLPFWLASFGSERLEPPDRFEQTLVGERRLGPIQAIRNQDKEAVHILRTRAATQA